MVILWKRVATGLSRRTLCLWLGLIVCFACVPTSESLHLKGTWRTGNFFKFLAKFGFQKTDLHDTNTLGHIYGNVTLKSASPKNASSSEVLQRWATLVVVDRQHFLEYYGNRSLADKHAACARMFNRINLIAYDHHCNQDGTEDFLRSLPCPEGQLCSDEDTPQHVVPLHQFTYSVHDNYQARFWYVSMVACVRDPRDPSCNWTASSADGVEEELEYDLWLVNGNPDTLQYNPFEFQFSFDEQDTVEVYLIFFALYLLLVLAQVYAALRYRHLLTGLFTCSLLLQAASLFFALLHRVIFAIDGVGLPSTDIIANVVYLVSQSLLMLLLLLLAKGWSITRPELTWKPFLFCVWLLYTCINVLLYVWNTTEVDVIEEIDEYQTLPGWTTLVFRLLIMVWFLYELRSTMMEESDQPKLRFYLDFGAGILVWFIYLPVVALIALNISALWRQKLLLGITCSADFLAFGILTHLLWPSKSQQYFQLVSEPLVDAGEELEEFSEAPHNVQRTCKV